MSAYQEWYNQFYQSVYKLQALPIALDWLEDRELNTDVFRDYLLTLERVDTGEEISLRANPELNNAWALESGLPIKDVGPFKIGLSHTTRELMYDISRLDMSMMNRVEIQGINSAVTTGLMQIFRNYRFEQTRHLTLGGSHMPKEIFQHIPGKRLTRIDVLTTYRGNNPLIGFLLNNKIKKGCKLYVNGRLLKTK